MKNYDTEDISQLKRKHVSVTSILIHEIYVHTQSIKNTYMYVLHSQLTKN